MVDFVLTTFGDTLQIFGLYEIIRNVQLGLPHNTYHLYNILEMFNPYSGTFFTLVWELGFALHKIFEVSLPTMRELSYEEYVPTTEELGQLKDKIGLHMRHTRRYCAILEFVLKFSE